MRAAKKLSEGGLQSEAAEAAGVTRQAVARWQRSPEFIAMVDAYGKPTPPTVALLPKPSRVRAPATLPEDWRRASALQLAAGVPLAVRCVVDALDSDDPPTKAQLDTARWLIERMAVAAPEEAAQDEITDAGTMAAELADAVPAQVLREALRIAGTG